MRSEVIGLFTVRLKQGFLFGEKLYQWKKETLSLSLWEKT